MQIHPGLCLLIFGIPLSGFSQSIQNFDIYFMAGVARTRAYAVPDTTVSVSASTGYLQQTGYGYQFFRTSAGSLWLDIPLTFSFPGKPSANVPYATHNTSSTISPGLRLMVPFNERVSAYAVAGGGIGWYDYSQLTTGGSGSVSTTHGVIDIGGGIDVRLTRHLSIRAEARDFITGRGLSGVQGRHHLVVPIGIALHY